MPVVHRGLMCFLLCFTHLLETIRSTEARVGIATGQKFIGIFAIELETLRLCVRAIRPFLRNHVITHHHSFIRIEPSPVQCCDDIFYGPGDRSFLIGVFDPEDKGPLGLLRNEIAVERRPKTADVEEASRRGWEAGTQGEYWNTGIIEY